MTRGRILLVEDDAAIALVISETLRAAGLDVTAAASIGARDRHLADHAVDLLITDVMLPDGDGLASLAACRSVMGDVPVIVLSAQNTLDTAIRAANEHAYEYLPKPFDIDQLTAAVTAALRTMPAAEPLPREETIDDFPIVGRSPAMQDVYRTIARVASNDLSVLVLGESGTGKELVARAIHMSGRRRDQPFVALNMAAIPRELIEAELFGHEKGAFTGAHARSPGRFEQAQGGTLFLDEIGDMPIEAQTRLLRVLQTGDYTPVGGSRLLRADVRIVAATNQDLTALVADGRFREDLFYRLNVIPVQLPPLRDRRSDIARLVRHFLDRAAADGLGAKAIASDALAAMEDHGWPGNVRELGNMVQRLVVLSRDPVIGRDDVLALLNQHGAVQGGQGDASRRHDLVEAVIGWARSRQGDRGLDGRLYDALLDEVEPALLSVVLEATGGNQLRAADRLGINRNTLRKKLQQERGSDGRQI